MKKRKVKFGLLGCGSIGEGVAQFLADKCLTKACLPYVYDINPERSDYFSKKFKRLKIKPVSSIKMLVKKSDIVIETASWTVIKPLIKEALLYKKDIVILSVGGLLNNKRLFKQAEKKGINIFIPSGAICGVDGILASAKSKLKKCVLTTSKPPEGLKNSVYIDKKKIKLDKIRGEKLIFQGTPAQAFKYFPKNINVASTLLFASGYPKIKVQIKVSAKLKCNIHQILLESDIGKINIRVENKPSENNPKTSALTISSAQALIDKILSRVKIGT